MTHRKWLKELRIKKRMTANNLADEVGVSSRSIFRWESGEETPSRSNIAKLTKLLGERVMRKFHEEERLAAALGVQPGDLLNQPDAPAEGAA